MTLDPCQRTLTTVTGPPGRIPLSSVPRVICSRRTTAGAPLRPSLCDGCAMASGRLHVYFDILRGSLLPAGTEEDTALTPGRRPDTAVEGGTPRRSTGRARFRPLLLFLAPLP